MCEKVGLTLRFACMAKKIYYKKYSPYVQICRSTGLHSTADLGLHVTLWVVIGFKTWLQLLQ